MRLKSAIWVAAYVRRCHIEGRICRHSPPRCGRGGRDLHQGFRLDGTAALYAPAPQTSFDEAMPTDRLFASSLKQEFEPETAAEAKIAREIEFDSDIWVVEVEDKAGRNFLNLAK